MNSGGEEQRNDAVEAKEDEVDKDTAPQSSDNKESEQSEQRPDIEKDIATEVMPVEPKEVTEEQVDEELVEEAYTRVTEIFASNYNSLLEEVGEYLLETFFDGDYKEAKEGKPVKEKSFNQLIKKFQNADIKAPSKSWCYNAINIAVDKKEFQEIGFSQYEQLKPTQKVYINRLNNFDKKKELIKDTIEKNYSVRELKEHIDAIKVKRDRLSLEDLSVDKDGEKLRTKSITELMKLKNKAEEKIKQLKNEYNDIDRKTESFEQSLNTIKIIIKSKEDEEQNTKNK